MSERINHIVLDSNFFYGRFNFMSSDVSLLLKRANDLKWKVFVPEPVKIEVVNGMKNEIPKFKTRLLTTLHDAKHLGIKFDFPEVNFEKLEKNFEVLFLEFLKETGMEILPFPSILPKHSELFELATKKSPPFDDKGQSYRDAIIWYAIEELSKKEIGSFIYFFTNDKNFVGRSRELSKNLKNINCFLTSEMDTELTKHLNQKQKSRISLLSEKLKKHIQDKELKKIKDLLLASQEYRIPIGSVENLKNIKSFDVEEVGIDSIIENSSKIKFVLKIIGKIKYTVGYFNFPSNFGTSGYLGIYASPDMTGSSVYGPGYVQMNPNNPFNLIYSAKNLADIQTGKNEPSGLFATPTDVEREVKITTLIHADAEIDKKDDISKFDMLMLQAVD